jgi:preprotein translocase subunit SecB
MNSEVSSEAFDKALKVGDRAEIYAIVMRDLEWKVQNNPNDGTSVEVNVEWRAEHSRYEPTSFAYRITAIIDAKTTDVDVYSLSISHELFFRVPSDFEISQDEFEAFGSTTVLQMAYPYIREWVSRLTNGGGVSPLVMPPLRIAAREVPGKD